MLRVFRVLRILRLLKGAKGVRDLLMTLVLSFPALVNVFGLLALCMFIYSILGVQLFAGRFAACAAVLDEISLGQQNGDLKDHVDDKSIIVVQFDAEGERRRATEASSLSQS